MNARELLLSIASGEDAEGFLAAAVTSPLTAELVNACGSSWPIVHRDSDSMARAAVAAKSMFELENVRAPFDQCVEAEALGAELSFEGYYPRVKRFIEDIGSFDFFGKGRTEVVVEAVRRLRKAVGEGTPVLAGVTGPFTVLGYLFGPTRLMLSCRRNPSAVVATSQRLSAAIADYASELVSAGADAVVIEDMASSPDVLNPSIFRSVEVEPLRALTSRLGAPCILHICGDTSSIVGDLPKTGVKVFHIDPKTNLEVVRARAPEIPLAGGVDTMLLLRGTPEEVSKTAVACARLGIRIIAPACALHPRTPSGNVKAMARAVRGFCQLS